MTATPTSDLVDEIDHLVNTISAERDVPVQHDARAPIDRLLRLEDAVRSSAASRQTLQKIASARRLLGDRTDTGRYKGPFLLE